MAPEIVSKSEYAGPPADVWALGVLLFALLCGRFPFKGQNDKELYSKICSAEFEMPTHISQGAKNLLSKIFRKDPDLRPTTKELLKDGWLIMTDAELANFSKGIFSITNNKMIQSPTYVISGRSNA